MNEKKGVDATRLRRLADFYETRPCAPSLEEYGLVDGLRAAAEFLEKVAWINAATALGCFDNKAES